jgi:hypothetical protein
MLPVRQAPVLLCVFLIAQLVGCTDPPTVNPHSLFDRFRPLQTPAGPDVVEMQVALIERPLYDSFLVHDLWAEVDEQILSLPQKLALDENGFRVGQVGGFAPTGLQKLLVSERSNANPRRIYVHAGNPASLTLGPVMPVCRFELPRDGEAIPVSLDQAECLLSVVPSLAGEDRIKLAFTPQIRYGQAQAVPRPTEDRQGFILRSEQPNKTFAALTWEVTLAPNQYVLVGARTDRPQSLGHQSFLRGDEPVPVQRLLALRVSRTSPGLPAGDLIDESDQSTSAKRPMPLVLQAAYGGVPK